MKKAYIVQNYYGGWGDLEYFSSKAKAEGFIIELKMKYREPKAGMMEFRIKEVVLK